MTGTVTIAAGTTSTAIDLNVLNDSLLESNESVTVTLDTITAGDSDVSIGAADTATIVINDDDTAEVSIVANDPGAAEPGDDGQFTVLLSGISDTDTVVSFSVGGDATSGVDFQPISGTVTIAAGTNSATIDLSVLDDSLIEVDEIVTVTLNAITSGDSDITIAATNSATIQIIDDDSAEVTITAIDPTAGEPDNNGQFLISLSGVSTTDTVVNYTVGGTATAGSDYTALSGSVTIAAGSSSAIIDLTVLDDTLIENAETVTVSLASLTADANITIGAADTATITIADDDSAQSFDHRFGCFRWRARQQRTLHRFAIHQQCHRYRHQLHRQRRRNQRQ